MTTEYVETRMIPVVDLTPFPGNARIGDKDALAESLDENGQYRSLIVRRTDDGELIVLCGNNTLEALELRGDASARCEIVKCDDATALRVNLIDNASNDKARYDEEKRARLLELLDGELKGTGYSEDEVDAILAQYEEPEITEYHEPDVTYNDTPEEREARIASRGGPESSPMVSRGIRDILLVLPNDQADELGRIIMRLRKLWGTQPQGEIVLRGMRVAAAAVDCEDDCAAAADDVYGAEAVSEDAGAPGEDA
jgi:ParB-like nuclease domain